MLRLEIHLWGSCFQRSMFRDVVKKIPVIPGAYEHGFLYSFKQEIPNWGWSRWIRRRVLILQLINWGHKFNIQDPQYKTIRVWRTTLHSYSSSTRYMEMWKVHGELLCGYMESYVGTWRVTWILMVSKSILFGEFQVSKRLSQTKIGGIWGMTCEGDFWLLDIYAHLCMCIALCASVHTYTDQANKYH